MNLHPDVLTDLVILYHAGEASQASRQLLEKEALQNPVIAAALATQPRVMQPIGADPMVRELDVLQRVRRYYLYRALMAIGVVLAFIALFTLIRASRPMLGPSHGATGTIDREQARPSPK